MVIMLQRLGKKFTDAVILGMSTQDHVGDCRDGGDITVDGTIVEIEHPADKDERKKHYSGKKKMWTEHVYPDKQKQRASSA